ncbi:MAG: hypothetical protein QXV21_05355 [Candidatus Bathyarchaeia archaeon]
MPKTWTAKGAGYLLSGIVGVIAGLWMITSLPESYMIGVFLLIISLVFIAAGLLSRREVSKENEKPLMEVATTPDDEDS